MCSDEKMKAKRTVVDFGIHAGGGFLITYSDRCQRIVDKSMFINMLNEKYSNQKIDSVTIWISGASHYPEKDRIDGMYYFELQTGDRSADTNIKKHVLVNNEGSIMSDRDILTDARKAGVLSEDENTLPMNYLESIYETINYH